MHPLLRIEHLEPWPDVTPEDEAAFTHYARELTVGYALRATLVLVVCVLVWWPVDLLVAPDSRYSHVFSGLRIGFLSIQASAFVAFVLDGRPAAAVARELGTTPNAVYLARNRVLTRVRAELAGLLD